MSTKFDCISNFLVVICRGGGAAGQPGCRACAAAVVRIERRRRRPPVVSPPAAAESGAGAGLAPEAGRLDRSNGQLALDLQSKLVVGLVWRWRRRPPAAWLPPGAETAPFMQAPQRRNTRRPPAETVGVCGGRGRERGREM